METMTDLQVSAYGAQLTSLKVYNFTLTDTGQISSTGSTGGGPIAGAGDRVYVVGGMTSQEIPFMLNASTGPFGWGSNTSPGLLLAVPRFNATSTGSGTAQLVVSWQRQYTSTAGTSPGATATGSITTTTGFQVSLFTLGVYAPAVSSST